MHFTIFALAVISAATIGSVSAQAAGLGSTTTPPSPSPTAVIVNVGGRCGGMPLPDRPTPRCAPGLICKYENPMIYDYPGICIDPNVNSTIIVGRGFPCDETPKPGQQICSSGLVCSPNPNTYPANYPEMRLTCEPPSTTTATATSKQTSPSPSPTVPISGVGGRCGGLPSPTTPRCASGLTCKYQSPIMYDFPGVCIDPNVNSTITVGQGIPCDDKPKPGQQICAAGLICSLNPNPYPSNYPELKYTCEKPSTTTTSKSPSPTVGNCVKKYNQCGGQLWQTKAECCPGAVCKYVNAYYSQCV